MVVLPDGTTTLVGGFATLASELVMVMVVPLGGAAADNTTSPVVVAPPTTDAGLTAIPRRAGAKTVTGV